MATKKEGSSVSEQTEKIIHLLQEWKGFEKIPIKEVLKKVEKRISLEKLFKPEEYSKLCKLEKKRILNIGNNLTVMMYIGMPLPSENDLRAKIGLPPRGGFTTTVSSNAVSVDDEEWKPNKSGKKKKLPDPLGLTHMLKREAWFKKNCMVDNEVKRGKANSKAFESIKKSIMPLPNMTRPEDSNKSSVKEEPKTDKIEGYRKCYPKRDVPSKLYTDPELPTEDDFLFCDDCSKLYLGDCPVHRAFTSLPDTPIKLGLVNRAERTCPAGISIKQSGIRAGGLGVWCDVELPRNTVFGPYEGVVIDKNNLSKLGQLFEGGYAWEIYNKGKLANYIDGTDVRQSNWLRYINCARNEEEQNLVAYQYKGKIYYRTYKVVAADSELLVWYGEQYAEHLGIPTEYKEQICKQRVKIERKICLDSFFPCPKCDKVFADEETLAVHLKAKHPSRSVVKRHKCPWCDYSTNIATGLKRHKRTHMKEKPVKCDICGKGFTQNGNLNRHKLVHSKVKPHECERCGKCFTERFSLKKHQRTVHDKRSSYVCPICGRTFGLASFLTTHIRIHTGEKPYKCEYCATAFSVSSALRKHVIARHTKQYPHKCKVCDKGFIAPNLLKSHTQKHHPNSCN